MKTTFLLAAIIATVFSIQSCSKTDNMPVCPSCPGENSRSLKSDPGELDDPPIITRFTGRVVDPDDTPISGANVELSGHELYQHDDVTDNDGYFSMDSVEAVDYQLSFSASGFQANNYQVDFDTISSDTLNWGIEVLQTQ